MRQKHYYASFIVVVVVQTAPCNNARLLLRTPFQSFSISRTTPAPLFAQSHSPILTRSCVGRGGSGCIGL